MTGLEADNLIQSCKANLPLFSNIDTKETMKLWLVHFSKIDAGLMKTAILLCQGTVRGFPQVVDIKNAIKEIQRDLSSKPKPQLEQPRAKWMSKAAAKAAAIVREGKAQEFFDSLDYSELHIFAKQYFPNIGFDLVKENSNEIQYCMEENNRCTGCQWTDGRCHSDGYYPVMVLNKNGCISWEMRMCGKKASAWGMNQRQSAQIVSQLTKGHIPILSAINHLVAKGWQSKLIGVNQQ